MSNCLIFAFRMWARHGGYVIVRKSNYGWWPHFMWVKSLGELEVTNFVPENPKTGLLLPPPLFKGKIVIGKDSC